MAERRGLQDPAPQSCEQPHPVQPSESTSADVLLRKVQRNGAGGGSCRLPADGDRTKPPPRRARRRRGAEKAPSPRNLVATGGEGGLGRDRGRPRVLRAGPAPQRGEGGSRRALTHSGASLSSSWNAGEVSAVTRRGGPRSAVSVKPSPPDRAPRLKSQDILAGSKNPARNVGGVPASSTPRSGPRRPRTPQAQSAPGPTRPAPRFPRPGAPSNPPRRPRPRAPVRRLPLDPAPHFRIVPAPGTQRAPRGLRGPGPPVRRVGSEGVLRSSEKQQARRRKQRMERSGPAQLGPAGSRPEPEPGLARCPQGALRGMGGPRCAGPGGASELGVSDPRSGIQGPAGVIEVYSGPVALLLWMPRPVLAEVGSGAQEAQLMGRCLSSASQVWGARLCAAAVWTWV
uniref:translation initiation factor IF-2-like n=1 Tax=Nyctereutes procyonoides TaxID=34880 RepID=UPI002443C11F|nr:translation initiation factor IF-2-like [Nyctereutes procyonoides]